jgi:hypothetical protein
MAGLLDGFGDFIKTPEGQGLLAATFGGLAGAQKGAPLNSLGRAGLAGLSGYGGALDREQQTAQAAQLSKYRDMQQSQMQMQMDEAKRKATEAEAQRAWRSGLPAVMDQKVYGAGDEGPTMAPDTGALSKYLMAPDSPFADDLLKARLFPKPEEAFTLGEGQVRYKGNQVVAQGPEKKVEEDSFTKLLRSSGVDPASPQGRSAYADMVRKQSTHAPAASQTVINKQEGEESKTVGKFFGESYADVQKAGMSAQGKVNRITRLSQLLDGVDTGKFTPLGVEVAKGAKAMGLNIDEKLSNKEAAVALSSEMALELRNPAGGAGMPGAMSDADRNFLAGMVPGIEKTPEGRKLISETYRKMAQRDIEVAKMARDYRTKNKSIDEGFYNELARYAESKPLFTSNAPPNVRAQADAILKGGR